jgi:predicted nucleotidyltransferase component of viral defense system
LPNRDYRKLYSIQETFLSWFSGLDQPFYLTGGTALGRFYLGHRYSEDLDFFVNAHPEFLKLVQKIQIHLVKRFEVQLADTLISEDFARFFIMEQEQVLKIDFVNDVPFHSGEISPYNFGQIDNPLNILTNKLSAIVGRDEPKDYYDLIYLALHYSFNWMDVFILAKHKALLNELEIAERLAHVPVAAFENIDWLIQPMDVEKLITQLKAISTDFLVGRENSLGLDKAPIISALPRNQFTL